MSGALTRCRVSSEQLHVLLSFMEEHRDFAAGKQSVYSRFSACKLWRLLAERLNAAADDAGGAHKSPDKWCRYWADIKYRARKKWAVGESLGDLSSVEERLQSILGTRTRDSRGAGAGGAPLSDEERRGDDDMYSEAEGAPGEQAPRLATEELLAEAAMRSALAAEKQAEAVAQGVELLRELLTLLRERAAPPPETTLLHHHRL
ncbi:uncharacterized protein LOC123868070 isoform X2 [Maniola jurtina]|uniref:uncharacterized protein LOC123868070 isoform X1 n=1 Tax=Maniola jurtina TaxID=191418 RepID=UPI001E68832C|nr:uncharacterized protein LOC123868070 isoform X1 [Maniola jurtina]XP_045766374.1 uncharacterized protein LOC123868070 isoform X2 [Maniola jurtina]